jgi:surface protein
MKLSFLQVFSALPIVALLGAKYASAGPCTLKLWDADTGAIVSENTPSQGEILCAQSWKYSIGILEEDCNQEVKSVYFELSGPDGYYTEQWERFSPYALFGNIGSTFFGQPWLLGDFTIKATVYGNNNFRTRELDTMEVDFSVKDCDECATDEDNCDPNATCKDTLSGYTCDCHEGYEGDGYRCVDAAKCFVTSGELRNAVQAYVTNPAADTDVAQRYGWPIGEWCVSYIEDFSWLFTYVSINVDIANWDVSNAKSMANMFYQARFFDSDLSSWNVSQVTDMNWMFIGAQEFSSDISSWDVSKVTNMYKMFYTARAFNSDISSWNVSRVTNMRNMFTYAGAFSQNLCSWGSMLAGGSVDVNGMFHQSTSCALMADPNMTATPPSPLCFICDSS